ncbi:MAG: UDP-N-acetylmuramoyl-L-alanyl-D-glutamate--2,6-diaminopimelate ligase [Candidatus Brocadiae bacterium]|nr:UDP-N-acetylmuramoyl-L-alanyl-D-glutamate--2,6-diaminopimelate ligase [Candidatus Brocadiia bacterium]
MKLSVLKEALQGATWTGFRDAGVTGVSVDSRRVRAGHVFIAVPGVKDDGAKYARAAVEAGAVAVVTARKLDLAVPQAVVADARAAAAALAAEFHGHPLRKLQVIGVTGTNGKTTTTHLLRGMIHAAGGRCGLLGTISYQFGRREIPADNTTPGPVELQEMFAEMVAVGTTHCVMEVSSHALHQGRIAGVEFAGAIFTNLTRDHLDYHRTMEAYRDAKALLFSGLGRGAFAAVNLDDPYGAWMRDASAAPVATFGLLPGADVRAEIHSTTLDGTRFFVRGRSFETPVYSPLIGRHNIQNILGAMAVLEGLGIPADALRDGAAAVPCVRGRLEPVRCGQPFAVLVDYAHTDDALINVLTALRPLTPGRLITVFGCGGDRDRGKRPLMARATAAHADLAVVTSDNPRTEDPAKIIEDVLAGFPAGAAYLVEPDRREAIRRAIREARPGDTVLIAGKGHETYQIFKDGVKPFDDRAVAAESLGRRLPETA